MAWSNPTKNIADFQTSKKSGGGDFTFDEVGDLDFSDPLLDGLMVSEVTFDMLTAQTWSNQNKSD